MGDCRSTSQQTLGATAVSNATVRMIARVTIPGDAVRIRLDNAFGTVPLVIGKAYIGQRIQGAVLATGSNRPVVFNKSASTTNDGAHKAILNEGIGGNTITRENLQPPPDSTPGIERLERDVLRHQGVTHVVLFMGTNDVRREASASQVITGTEDIIKRVKARGLKIIGATMIPRHNRPPDQNNTGWNAAKTAVRNEVNQWIRAKAPFDAIIDFDKVVQDSKDANLIYAPFNCGDGIHPSPRGYYEMGKSVRIDLFR